MAYIRDSVPGTPLQLFVINASIIDIHGIELINRILYHIAGLFVQNHDHAKAGDYRRVG